MIRPATLLDLPAIGRLCARFHAESAQAHVPYDADKVARVATGLMDHPRGLVLVAERGGLVVGGLFAVAEEMFYSEALFSIPLGTFVAPRHRGGMTGPRLIRAYVDWAKALGVACINDGVVSGITPARTIKLYQAIGFVPVGIALEYQGD